MGAEPQTDWNAAIASALDWWREAGVDTEIDEAPRDWLAPSLSRPAPLAATDAAVAEVASPAATLPTTLEAFVTWRTSVAVPEARWGAAMLGAEGPATADLMVVIEMPEREDAAAGQLLSGANGRLFDAMLRAIGRDRGSTHLTAVAIARPATGRIPPDSAEVLAAIARHHVGLAAPRAILLFGNASRAIIGQECAPARGVLHAVNHDGGKAVAVASFHPRTLIEKPQLKAEAWRDLQLLAGALR